MHRGWILATSLVAAIAGFLLVAHRAARIEWPENPTVTVRVVHADGTPAPNARVDVGALRARRRGAWSLANLERPLVDPEPAASFTSGADGTVALPWHWSEFGDVPVTASRDGSWGEVVITAAAPHGSVHEVQIAPDTKFSMRVLDAEGQPAANVELHAHGTLRRSDGSDNADQRLAAARTGADGTVTFVHAQHWTRHVSPRGRQRPFAVRTWMAAHATAALDGAALPRDPVELQLPPTGRVEIVTLDETGAPLHENVFVVITAIGDDSESFGLAPANPEALVLPYVPLGKSWYSWMPGISGRLEFEGPRRAGEVVRVTLRATLQPLLTGRLLIDGAPVVGAAVRLSEDGEPLGEGHSDALGRFVAPYRSFWTGLHGDIDIAARTAAGEALSGGFRGRLRRDGNTFALGDVRLTPPAPPPVMVTGRVFAPRGLESLTIGVHQQLGDGDSTSSVLCDVTLTPDGTFVVHGPDPGQPLYLSLTSDRHEPLEGIRFRFGATNREFALRPAILVHVPFVIGSRELAQCLRYELQEIGEHATTAPDRTVWSDEGTMTCTWITSDTGAHRVLVSRHGDPDPIVTSALRVDAGDDHECRVVPVAVPKIRVLRITLPEGARNTTYPPPIAELVGTERRDTAVADGDGAWILASDTPVDLLVAVASHRAVTLRGVDADRTVSLEPGIPIAFDVDPPELSAGETMSLTITGDEKYSTEGAELRGKRATARVPAAGTYSVLADVWPSTERRFVCDPSEIVVGENGGTFAITVRPAKD